MPVNANPTPSLVHPLRTRVSAVALAAAFCAGCATPSAGPPPAGAASAASATSTASSASAPAAKQASSGSPAPTVAANPPVPPAAPTVPGAAPARPADAAAPRPFAEVTRDAHRQDGFVPVWRKDDKVWLEIGPEQMGKPMLFSINVASSVGERGLYASQMGPRWMVEFRRVGNQMQLVAKQLGFRGDRDKAAARAVGEGFSDSLVGATPVVSAEHPERKSVLIDAGFLLGDIAGYSTALEEAYRLPFAADRANSYFERVRAEPDLTTLTANVHYAVARIPAPPLLPPGAPAPLTPPPPGTTPDPRSLFIGFTLNLRELPAQPMAVRAADPRVGFFTDSYTDLSDDLRANPRVHPIRRWRLEKKDPQAAMSEPVKPITYWLDRNIPQRYRASIEAGILEWNKAFERIGFKNAIVVRQQPDDADFNDMDAGHASIRWFVGADVGFAIGPSHTDPRTGEILDADIGMSDVFGRGARRLVREDLGSYLGTGAPAAVAPGNLGTMAGEAASCSYAADGAEEMGFALDLLTARGDLDPDSPEAEAFVQAYIKSTITHEVGHTLGLRHNFKASTTVTEQHLSDPDWSKTHAISGSVMDYNAFNLPLSGEPRPEPNMTSLGAYDYWAIEYAYKPVDPAHEKAELQAIAGRSAADPALAFGDDGDAGGFPGNDGLDPLANRFDLGDDPLAYYQRRMSLTKELWKRVQDRGPQAGDDPDRLRRSVLEGLRQLSRVPPLAAKYVGGMYTSRDLPGSGKPTFRPVDPTQQRQALRFLTSQVFSSDSFRFKPEFLASLTPDYIESNRAGPLSVPAIVLQLQSQTLDRLMDAGTARRLLELSNYLPENQRKGAITLNEVYGSLQDAVWSELKTGKEIDPLRRNLQREHLKRLQAELTRPSAALPADAISLARMHAVALQAQLRSALARKGLSVESRAHLEDALALLTEALRATLQRG